MRRLAPLVALLAVLISVPTTFGQPDDASLDVRLLQEVYAVESPLARGTLRAADLSAYPAFGLAVPVTALVAWQRDTSYEPAYRLMVTEGAAVLAVGVLKRLYARDRPYLVRDDVTSRATALDAWLLEHDPLGFPSGHAALSFAVATSLALSYPQWQVAVPGAVWATLVSVSRVWLGVHYPSDVLTGAVLGAATAYGTHLLRNVITPEAVVSRRLAFGGTALLTLRVPL